MRAIKWITGLAFATFLAVFLVAPGDQRDALFAEISGRYSEAGPTGVIASLSDGTVAGLAVSRVSEMREMAARQIEAELSTIDEIRSGTLKVGVDEAPVKQPATASVGAEPTDIVKQDVALHDPAPEASAATVESITRSMPVAEPTDAEKPGNAATVPQTEDMFSGIITKEDRENQAAETSFWTEERIQEALENGEPTSGGKRMCLFGCD